MAFSNLKDLELYQSAYTFLSYVCISGKQPNNAINAGKEIIGMPTITDENK